MCVRTFVVVCSFAVAVFPAAAHTDPLDSDVVQGVPAAGEGEESLTASRYDDTSAVGGDDVTALGEDAAAGMTNEDVVEMARAGLGHSTILAAIRLNATLFDVSPRGLVALANAGVPEGVVEAMLEAEAENRRGAATGVEPEAGAEATADAAGDALAVLEQMSLEALSEVSPEALAQMSPEALALLSRMAEQLMQQSVPDASAAVLAAADVEGESSLRAWLLEGERRTPLGASTAQVAFTDARSGPAALGSLQNIAGSALSFVHPALGLAGGLGSLFRSGDPTVTAVWALPGHTSSRTVAQGAAFEAEFAAIPGIDPDRYQPAVVRLIPTPDNFRLVGAARTRASSAGAPPDGSIVEEPVPVELTRLARGRYRVETSDALDAGEYALVLRPVVVRERSRRRNAESSLGDLMGGQSERVLYTAWDFSIRP